MLMQVYYTTDIHYLRLDLERTTARRLALLLFSFGSGPAQDLEEVCGSLSHPRVDVGLGGFDVVVEVVAEGLDV